MQILDIHDTIIKNMEVCKMAYRIIEDSINLNLKSVEVFDEVTKTTSTHDLFETDNGWYINYDGEIRYILVPSED